MTPRQTAALARLRKMVWERGSLGTAPEGPESKYEVSRFEVEESGRALYVRATVRTKNPETLGHVYPTNFLVQILPGGCMFQLNAKSPKTGKLLKRVRVSNGYLSICTAF